MLKFLKSLMGPIRHINCVLADIKTCFLSKENGTCFIKIWQLRVKGTEIKLQSTNLNKTTKKLVTQLGKRNENEGIKGRLNMYSSISKSCRRRVLAASEQSVTAATPAPESESQGPMNRDTASAWLGVFQREPSEHRTGVSVSGQMKDCFNSSC